MKINTAYFGTQEVDPESVLTFPDGLPGFEGCTRFKLFHEQGKPTVFWLQSLDESEVSFSVASPEMFGMHYALELTDQESERLALSDPADAAVLLMLSRPEEGDEVQETATGAKVRVHLRGPLILNLVQRRGLQKQVTRLSQSTLLHGE